MFGKSLFQSVLDRLEAEDVREDEDKTSDVGGTRSSGIKGLNTSLAFDTERATGQAGVHQAYADTAAPDVPQPDSAASKPSAPQTSPAAASPPPPDVRQQHVPTPRPAHLDRLTPAEVAQDLGLLPSDTIAMLADKRRTFAITNHPDRYPPEDRTAATRRMTIANMLVDEAQRRLTARNGRRQPARRSEGGADRKPNAQG